MLKEEIVLRTHHLLAPGTADGPFDLIFGHYQSFRHENCYGIFYDEDAVLNYRVTGCSSP